MSVTRRQTMQLITGLLLAACGSGGSVRQVREASGKHAVVIGAGMAGAKAARDLSDAGFDVTVLEARKRIGGRTWSDTSLGVPLDMGASWIHGIRGNPMTKLAKRLGQPMVAWDYENMIITDPRDEGRAARIEENYELVLGALWRVTEEVIDANPRATLQDVIEAARSEGLFGELTQAELDFIIASEIDLNAAATPAELSLEGILSVRGFGGHDAILPQGYQALTAGVLDSTPVRTDAAVTGIDYSGPQIRVTTTGEELAADHVVITVPLGVLKNGTVQFTPALPEEKQAAIGGLEMGVLNKVYLRFDEILWEEVVTNFGRIPERRGEFIYWVNLATASGQPVLCALNGGAFGRAIEAYSDTEIVDQALASLRDIQGGAVPQPSGHAITRWASDPYSFGAYSFVGPQGTSSMRADLAAPLGNKVFFAGEATETGHASTVHGAYLSGRRAAREVIQAVRAQ